MGEWLCELKMKVVELGHFVLYVTNLKRSVRFYNEVLGFPMIIKKDNLAVFSTGRTHHEMLLIEIGGEPKEKTVPEPGLYHVGLKIGDSHEDIVKAHKELVKAGVVIIGTGDHTVTHSIYVLDPDGNELELYADVSDKWKKDKNAILAPTKVLSLE